MVEAMKAHDELRLGALRMMKAALKKHQVDSMKPLDEAAEMQVLKTLVKQRIEAAEAFRKGNRPEMADKEDAERAIVESFLPAAPSAAEMESGAAGLKQMGAVMKAAQAKLAGKLVDGKTLSELVRARLS
jgi:uncharacterized protein YqeY